MSLRGLIILDESQVVLLQAAVRSSTLNGFAALTVVEIHRQIFAGVAVDATICSLAAIDKEFVFTHNINTSVT